VRVTQYGGVVISGQRHCLSGDRQAMQLYSGLCNEHWSRIRMPSESRNSSYHCIPEFEQVMSHDNINTKTITYKKMIPRSNGQ
jgi:hypothetical protein